MRRKATAAVAVGVAVRGAEGAAEVVPERSLVGADLTAASAAAYPGAENTVVVGAEEPMAPVLASSGGGVERWVRWPGCATDRANNQQTWT